MADYCAIRGTLTCYHRGKKLGVVVFGLTGSFCWCVELVQHTGRRSSGDAIAIWWGDPALGDKGESLGMHVPLVEYAHGETQE